MILKSENSAGSGHNNVIDLDDARRARSQEEFRQDLERFDQFVAYFYNLPLSTKERQELIADLKSVDLDLSEAADYREKISQLVEKKFGSGVAAEAARIAEPNIELIGWLRTFAAQHRGELSDEEVQAVIDGLARDERLTELSPQEREEYVIRALESLPQLRQAAAK